MPHIHVLKIYILDPQVLTQHTFEYVSVAGHIEAAEVLQVKLEDPYAWDTRHSSGTPTRARLGLLSPSRKHLIESTAPRFPKRHVFS